MNEREYLYLGSPTSIFRGGQLTVAINYFYELHMDLGKNHDKDRDEDHCEDCITCLRGGMAW